MAPTLPSNNLYYTNYLNQVECNKYQIEEYVIYRIIGQLHDWIIYGELGGDTQVNYWEVSISFSSGRAGDKFHEKTT